jgi:hypothetical protein
MSLFYAVFGDVHGRVALMMTLSKLWQDHSQTKLDGILQVGDMGAYPDHSRLDSATVRHAKRDPDELDYINYISETDSYRSVFGALETPVVFVRGNHEDFEYLSQFRQPAPVDPWGRITYVPNGHCYELVSDTGQVRIASFGGIAPKLETCARGQKSRDSFGKSRQRSERNPKRFTRAEAEKAFLGARDIDILMTHAGPEMPDFSAGSVLLRKLCDRLQPRVHLFGHHHRVYGPAKGPVGECLVGLEHVDFDRQGDLKEGCWGILEVSEDKVDFHFGELDRYPWRNWIRRDTYRQFIQPNTSKT